MSKLKDETKRTRILQAATKVFSQRGFAFAKINEIARDASVADGTIYLYFKNKDDLLLAVFEHNMNLLIPHMKKALETSSHPLEKLRIFIETHLALVTDHKDLARVFQLELQKTQSFMQTPNNLKLEEYLSILEDIIRAGQEENLLRRDFSAPLIKRVIFGALTDTALEWLIASTDVPSLVESAEQIYQMMVGGLAGKTLSEGASLSKSKIKVQSEIGAVPAV